MPHPFVLVAALLALVALAPAITLAQDATHMPDRRSCGVPDRSAFDRLDRCRPCDTNRWNAHEDHAPWGHGCRPTG